MSPRTGRPIVGEEPKNKQIAFRTTETVVRKMSECAEMSEKTKTELFENMVNTLHQELTEKNK